MSHDTYHASHRCLTRAGQIHINLNNLTTSCLDKFGFIIIFNGNSNLPKNIAFKLFMVCGLFLSYLHCLQRSLDRLGAHLGLGHASGRAQVASVRGRGHEGARADERA